MEDFDKKFPQHLSLDKLLHFHIGVLVFDHKAIIRSRMSCIDGYLQLFLLSRFFQMPQNLEEVSFTIMASKLLSIPNSTDINGRSFCIGSVNHGLNRFSKLPEIGYHYTPTSRALLIFSTRSLRADS